MTRVRVARFLPHLAAPFLRWYDVAGMDQTQANEAVQECMRRCLDEADPLDRMRDYLDELTAQGWPVTDIANVRNVCLRMLALMHKPDSEAP